jgi:hypothetical protein
MVRPCAPHRYSPPRRSAAWSSRSRRPAAGHNRSTGQPPHRGDRFPSSAPEPESRSRHHPCRTPIWPVSRRPPDSSQGNDSTPVLNVIDTLSTLHRWFAFARLHDPHLTRSRRAFSATLSTPALDRRTSRWFAITPCRATAKGHQTNRPGSFISRAAPHPSVKGSLAGSSGSEPR